MKRSLAVFKLPDLYLSDLCVSLGYGYSTENEKHTKPELKTIATK